jgi:hypothetical protein
LTLTLVVTLTRWAKLKLDTTELFFQLFSFKESVSTTHYFRGRLLPASPNLGLYLLADLLYSTC